MTVAIGLWLGGVLGPVWRCEGRAMERSPAREVGGREVCLCGARRCAKHRHGAEQRRDVPYNAMK